MKCSRLTNAFSAALLLLPLSLSFAAEQAGEVILEDHFDRQEKDPKKEQVGNGWGTNSQKRAQGVKQADLADGALHITRADVADHGVSVTHEAAFKDASIQMRFRLGAKDDLGVNIADMKEKTVHAGHICVARVRLHRVEMTDLKTGRMDLKRRQRRLDGKATDEDKQRLKQTTKNVQVNLAADQWHQLEVRIIGDTMTVSIDDKLIGKFQSPGVAHPTKSRLRLSVNKTAWVDDVKIVRFQ